MSRTVGTRRRRLVVCTALVLISSVLYAPRAFAETTCVREVVDGYDRLTVNLVADEVTAVRFFGDTVDISDSVNADATDFVPQQANLDQLCIGEVGIDLLVIDGPATNSGVETLKIIEAGTSGETNGGQVHTIVDLGAGTDTVEFMTADTNNNGVSDPTEANRVALGTSSGTGGTVVDQGQTEGGINPQVECVGAAPFDRNGFASDCSDFEVIDANKLRVTGGTIVEPDIVDAQGDFDTGEVISDPGGASNPVIPGTAGNDGLDADGSGDFNDNEPNGGTLQQPLIANLNAGEDFIAPGDGDDILEGGGGADSIEYGEAVGAVDIDLGAGSATGASGTDSFVNFQNASGTVFDENVIGSGLANYLGGFCGNDFIAGRAEDDNEFGDDPGLITIFTFGFSGGCQQDDFLPDIANGSDTFFQEAVDDGADFIDGQGSVPNVALAPGFADTVDYGDRTTDLYLNQGGGAVSGAGGCPLAATCEDDDLNGLEFFIAGSGNDTFVGSGNHETFQGGAGNDNMSGGAGEDWFDFSDSAAAITVDVPAGTATGHGDDTFDGTVEGFNGSEQGDTLNDDTATNNLYWGNGGDDLFSQGASPSADSDAFNGGDGTDTLDYGARSEDLSICLNGENPDPSCDEALNGEAPEADLAQDDIENVIAGLADDSIFANERNNVLTDGDGNDVVDGAAGNDTFDQGSVPNGADQLDGNLRTSGGGADFVNYGARTGDVRVSLGQNSDNNGENCDGASADCEGDTLAHVENGTTGSGSDRLVGSDDDNLLNGGAGNDLVNGAGGQDVMDGGDGVDRVTYATGVGVKINLAKDTAQEIGGGSSGGLDKLDNFENAVGSLKADIIAGDAVNNVLAGLAGQDIIKGKKGDDKLKGSQSKDSLNGGPGADSGNGGPGRDACSKIENKTSCEK